MASSIEASSGRAPSWVRTRAFQYALIGLLSGFLFPLAAITLELARRHFPVSLSNVIMIHRTAPPMWIIETAPLVLGLVAALAGRRQDLVLRANSTLIAREAELTAIRDNLEQIVSERTQELDQKNAQMRAVIQFARQLAEFQDLPSLLTSGARTLAERFNLEAVELYLLDENGRSATLRASASSSGRNTPKEGYRIAVSDQNTVGRVIRRGRLIISAAQPTRPEVGGRTSTTATGTEIALPLKARGRVVGVLNIRAAEAQAAAQTDAETYQLVADQFSSSIENLRLVTASQTTAEQLKGLASQSTQGAWKQYLRNRDFAYRFTPTGIQPLSEVPTNNGKDGLQVPLALRGQVIGSIALRRRQGGAWTQADQDLMDKVASQVVLALENARLLEETRQRAVQEQAISDISVRLNRSLDVDAVLQAAVREFAALPDVAEAEVLLATSNDDATDSSSTAA